VQGRGSRVFGLGSSVEGSGGQFRGSDTYLADMCSASEEGSGLIVDAHRLMHHSTLGLVVINKKKVRTFPRDASIGFDASRRGAIKVLSSVAGCQIKGSKSIH